MKKTEGSPFQHDDQNSIERLGGRLQDAFSKVLEEVTGNTPSSPTSPEQEQQRNDIPPLDTPEHAHEEHPL